MNPEYLRGLALELDPDGETFIGFENFGKWLGKEYNEIREALHIAADALELKNKAPEIEHF